MTKIQRHPWEDRFYDPSYMLAGAGDRPQDQLVDAYLASLDGRGGQVIDIGCGTGRLTLPLARRGWSVIGVDASAAMLEALRGLLACEVAVASRVRLIESPLERLTGVRASTAIAVDDFLTHFLTEGELHVALAAIRDLLDLDGVCFTDLRPRQISRLARAEGPGPWPLHGFGVSSGGALEGGGGGVSVVGWDEYKPSSRLLTSHQQFSVLDAAGRVLRVDHKTIRQRLHTIAEVCSCAVPHGLDASVIISMTPDGDGVAWEAGALLALRARN